MNFVPFLATARTEPEMAPVLDCINSNLEQVEEGHCGLDSAIQNVIDTLFVDRSVECPAGVTQTDVHHLCEARAFELGLAS